MRVWPARHATVPHSVRSPQVFMSKLAGLPVTWSSIARPSLAFSIVVLLSRGGDVVGAAPCVVAVAVFLACLIWVDLLFAGFADGHGSSPEMSSGMMAGTRPGAAVAMVLPSRVPGSALTSADPPVNVRRMVGIRTETLMDSPPFSVARCGDDHDEAPPVCDDSQASNAASVGRIPAMPPSGSAGPDPAAPPCAGPDPAAPPRPTASSVFRPSPELMMTV